MSGPIVFISRHRIKEGKREEFERFFREGIGSLEREKPRTVFQHAYLDDEDVVSFVHVFPDQESMALHMEGARERAADAYRFLEPEVLEIYGRPDDAILEQMRQAAAAGVELVVRSENLGGFIRLG